MAVPPCGVTAATASAIVGGSRVGPVMAVMPFRNGATTIWSSSRRKPASLEAACRTNWTFADMLWLLSISSVKVAAGASDITRSIVCGSPSSRRMNCDASSPAT